MDWQVTYGGDKDPIRVLNKGKEVYTVQDPKDRQDFMKLAQPATGETPTMGKIQNFINTKAQQNKVNLPPDFILANVQDQNGQPAPAQAQNKPGMQPKKPVENGQVQVVDNQEELQLSNFEYEGEQIILQENGKMESLNAFKRNADRMLPSKDGKSFWNEKAESTKARRNTVAGHLLDESFVGEMADEFLAEENDNATNDDTETSMAIKNVKKNVKVKDDECHQDVCPTDPENNATPENEGKGMLKKDKEYMDKKLSKMDDFRINKPLVASQKNKTNLMDKGEPESDENLETDMMSTPGKTQKGYEKPDEIKRSKTGFHKQESKNPYKKQVAQKYGISEGEAEFMVESALEK